MKQSRAMSLVEAIANVIVGYGVAVVTQIVIFPIFGLHTTLAQNLQMGGVFTMVSIVRSFALRRVFESLRSPVPTCSDFKASQSKAAILHWSPRTVGSWCSLITAAKRVRLPCSRHR